MSHTVKLIALFGFVAALSACGGQQEEEVVVVEPEPITTEPVYTGKYK
ncbi:hypothetical protein ROJ8625_01171 [Roseivivax jejudonensis]|uniref:Lipoprotein n=1 Tax=Roseivivax jejudonensis TaxID=1529041 RepID=A0A1X6YQX3_9RHOB|nr:hypothetical protein [Roseivivax jejudonensis]SLN28006.1 hypothetical protein ROJ8625_01171 [Roseivivax jejudonensis]